MGGKLGKKKRKREMGERRQQLIKAGGRLDDGKMGRWYCKISNQMIVAMGQMRGYDEVILPSRW